MFHYFDLIFVIFVNKLVIYSVFYEESESEVNKCKDLEPGGKQLNKNVGLKAL